MPKLDSPEPQIGSVWRTWSWPVRIALGVGVLIIAALLIDYAMYREWPWSTYPSTLKACGRDFQKAGTPETRDQIEAGHAKLVRVGDIPGWFNQGDLWAHEDQPPFTGNCRLVMFVHGDGDEFQEYDLVGGP